MIDLPRLDRGLQTTLGLQGHHMHHLTGRRHILGSNGSRVAWMDLTDLFFHPEPGWKLSWLVVWWPFLAFSHILGYIGNFIIPTDFHIFQRGAETTNQSVSWIFFGFSQLFCHVKGVVCSLPSGKPFHVIENGHSWLTHQKDRVICSNVMQTFTRG